MTYRTKLMLVLMGTALASSAGSLAVMYVKFRALTLEQMKGRVMAIATTGAIQIDVERHESIRTTADEHSDAYRRVATQLRRVRDANRGDDVSVTNVYTLRPSAAHPEIAEFVVDADEPASEGFSHVGEKYKSPGYRFVLAEPKALLLRDQWGDWLSAGVPIRDATGKAVGELGVDVDAKHVGRALDRILRNGVLSLGAALALAVAGAIILSKRVSRPLYEVRRTVDAIGQGNLDARVAITTHDEFGAVGRAINTMIDGLRERQAVKSAFARYVSDQVMDTILQSGKTAAPEGERRKITVLFSDIRGFTSLAERMRPEEVVRLLNEYFEAMIDVVFRHHGTLDKFIGDGLMVLFGAPQDDVHQEEHALRAALEMQAEMRRLGTKWEAEGRAPLRIGIGIHSGYAIVGSVGSTKRMEYTAVGDCVNLASRLESATKDLAVDILVSEPTYAAAGSLFQFRAMGPVAVKGRAEPIVAYAAEGLA